MAAAAGLLTTLTVAASAHGAPAGALEATSVSAPDSAFTYSGYWIPNNGEHYSWQAGSSASLDFTVGTGGGAISLLAATNVHNHTEAVSIDAQPAVNLNLYAATDTRPVTVWTSPVLPAGRHTIRVTVVTINGSVMGAKLSNGTFGTATTTSAPTSSTAPTTPTPTSAAWSVPDSAFSYSGSWVPNNGEHYSMQAGSDASLTFSIPAGGGKISLLAAKNVHNHTEAVSIDGQPGVNVDLYATSDTRPVTVWTSSLLPAGQHVMRVTVQSANGSIMGANFSNSSAAAPVTTSPSTTSAAPTPTPQPTPTPAPSTSSAPTSSPSPIGVPGRWALAFDDEFNGTSLDTSKWVAFNSGTMNHVTRVASDVSVSGGNLVLTLSDSSHGGMVSSAPYDGAGAGGYLLPVGGYVEARVMFPGDGTSVYNWSAWWVCGPNWPASGEHDVAEVLSGQLTVNYHSPSGAHNQGAVPGYWGNAFHTYGLYRAADHADVYWDGRLVKSYRTDDNGQPEAFLINAGYSSSHPMYGAAGALKVDYVRAWKPA